MQTEEQERLATPPAHEPPPITEYPAEDAAPVGDDPAARRSLFDDFEALIDDARIYAEAEWSYQKTRAGFVASRTKSAIAYGAIAAYFAVLATIGLTVGLIIALTPLITAWGATALVVAMLLLVAYLMVRRASGAWREMSAAMHEEPVDE